MISVYIQYLLTKNSIINLERHDVGWIKFDVTFVDTALHKKVTRYSPVGAPWITDDPVVNSVEITPANDDNAVIDGLSITLHVVVNSAPI